MSIEDYVAKKLKSGTYKLVANERGTSAMWSIFAMIAEENGSVLDGFVYCRQCKTLVKYSRRVKHNAYRHKCFTDLKYTKELNIDADDDPEEESMIDESDPISATEQSNVDDNVKEPMEEENSFEGTKEIRKNSLDDYIPRTSRMPIRTKLRSQYTRLTTKENLHKHIKMQIRKGVYGLKDKRGCKSTIWSYFKTISDENGSPINGLVWCPRCEKLLTSHANSTSNLSRHKCILKYFGEDELPLAKRAKVEEDTDDVRSKGSNDDLLILSEPEDMAKEPPQIDEEEEEYVTSESEFFSVVKVENENITEEDITWEEGHPFNPNEKSTKSLRYKELEENVKSGVYSLMKKKNVKSTIWSVFDVIVKEDGIVAEGYVYCRGCKRLLKFNGRCTSNLNRHKCYLLAVKTSEQKKVTKDHKKEAIDVCSLWLLQDCLPCNMIEGKGFRKMLNFFIKLGAVYGENVDIVDLLPDSTTVAETIRTIAEEKKSKIKLQIEKMCNDISVTVDLWPDYYLKRHFVSATLHFQKNYELNNIQLGIKSTDINTSAQDVRNKLERLLNEFGINNMENIVFVTDSQSVIKDALLTCSRLICSNYLFSKVVDTAIERTSELNGVIDNCKHIVEYCKKEHIKMKNNSACSIQCSSQYVLIKSIADNWQQVQDVLNESTPHLLTKKKFAILNNVVQLFQKFEVIFKKLQGSRAPSICFVIPSINCIKAFCECKEIDDPAIVAFKSSILNGLEETWLPNITLWHKAAFFLYPPANKEQTNDLNEIKDFCIQQTIELENNFSMNEKATNVNLDSSLIATPSTSLESPDTEKNSCNEDINFFFPTLVRKPPPTVAKCPEEEVNRYSIENVMIDANFDVIQWWQQNSTNYPRLSKLAIRILSIPASNTSTHRFALAGNMVSEKLNKFSPKTVDSILFLNSIQETDF